MSMSAGVFSPKGTDLVLISRDLASMCQFANRWELHGLQFAMLNMGRIWIGNFRADIQTQRMDSLKSTRFNTVE